LATTRASKRDANGQHFRLQPPGATGGKLAPDGRKTSKLCEQNPLAHYQPHPSRKSISHKSAELLYVLQKKLARRLIVDGKTVSEVARTFGGHPSNVYRALSLCD
jgi:hypothetical protein